MRARDRPSLGRVVSGSVLVVTGGGAIGLAALRRLAPGRRTLLTDISQDPRTDDVDALRRLGHDVTAVACDVSDPAVVAELASLAAALGSVDVVVHTAGVSPSSASRVVHTAGVSPSSASTRRIYEVNLVGTALVIDAFAGVIAARGALVAVASMAALRRPVARELENALATTPAAQLLAIPGLAVDDEDASLAWPTTSPSAECSFACARPPLPGGAEVPGSTRSVPVSSPPR
jgi:NAD(P)-dependent dehydrogenase (short-subunit alcohol dehydrogenase family)